METKIQVKREMKPQDSLQRKTQLLFLDLGRLAYLQAWGQTGLPASLAIPRARSSGAGLGKSNTIARDRTEPRPAENRVDY